MMNKLYGLLLGAVVILAHQPDSKTSFVPAAVQPGPSKGQFVSSASGLDAPKVHPINGTAYEWWYFDSVSNDADESIVVVFFTSSNAGYSNKPKTTSVDSVEINSRFRNGTTTSVLIPATNATLVAIEDGSSGDFAGTGCSWRGTPNNSQYVITVDSPTHGIYGTLQLDSIAPQHYACGPAVQGQKLEAIPTIGWSNAVPDSKGVANFTMKGTEIGFTGSGYHDHNWGVVPLTQQVKFWYWGRGRLGEYSLVWTDSQTPDNTPYPNVYVSRHGEIIASQCSGIQVRPRGANSTYPPTLSSGEPEGFTLSIDLGAAGALEIELSRQTTLTLTPNYKRWIGQLKGGFRNSSTVMTGTAVYEQTIGSMLARAAVFAPTSAPDPCGLTPPKAATSRLHVTTIISYFPSYSNTSTAFSSSPSASTSAHSRSSRPHICPVLWPLTCSCRALSTTRRRPLGLLLRPGHPDCPEAAPAQFQLDRGRAAAAAADKPASSGSVAPTMGFSVIHEQQDAILQEIKNITQGDWKCLIVDRTAQRIIDNVVKEDDILNNNIATIENIEDRREFNPEMDAIYLLAPEPYSVDCLLADFECRRYRRGYLLWTNLLDPKLRRRLDDFPNIRQARASSKTLFIDFYPRESHLVTFRDPWSFPMLFHPACNGMVPQHMQILAQRIAGVCITLGEYPKVRYYRPQNAFHEASVLCSHLARFIQEELDGYAQWDPNFPPPSNRPQSNLVITDRSMDIMAPLVHEFTYQAMAHDLLPIKEGDKVTFHTIINKDTAEEQEKDVELSEKDKIWVDNRHRHMKDTIDKLMGDFRKFIEQNPHFTDENADTTNLNSIRDMLAGLPEFQEMKEAYSLHLTMAQECMNIFQGKKLPDIASLEQTMATGLDEDLRKPKNVLESVVQLLDDDAISPSDRLRLIVVYILYRGGVIMEDIQKLLSHAALPPQDGEVFTNLELLGGKTSHVLKEPRHTPTVLFPVDPKAAQISEEYGLSRFEPVLKPLLDALAKGTLDQTVFPYVKPPLDPNEDLLAAQGGSLRAGRPNWAAAGRRPPENRPRILVFMAGGATYSESRACYDVGRERGRDIVLITSHMLTPQLFIRQIGDLSRDKRQLDLPMERPKPRAPAHLFERPAPPPQIRQTPPGPGGPMHGGPMPGGPMPGGPMPGGPMPGGPMQRMGGGPGPGPGPGPGHQRFPSSGGLPSAGPGHQRFPSSGGLPGRPGQGMGPMPGAGRMAAPMPPVPNQAMANMNLNPSPRPPSTSTMDSAADGKAAKEKKKRNFLGRKK
ncbi:hypothetical protein HIM_00768 [Hirsutella minnesotensis 3608]|nr:hypothetical protein HIM_00768 [Hirsutella minnesotensis 3608]